MLTSLSLKSRVPRCSQMLPSAFAGISTREGSLRSHLKKDLHLSEIKDEHITFFKDALGSEQVITQSDLLERYNTDWTLQYKGHSKLMLTPRSTEDVQKVLKFCNSNNLGVLPQGGNTGLVGGSIPLFDEIIINMQKMNKINNFDKNYGIIQCEAGCLQSQVSDYLKGFGHKYPLDIRSKHECQIGGNLATNAGGVHYIKYGSLHANTIGMKIVLANGTILDNMTLLRKDNTGYDLKHLFIGGEGTLGIITEAAILCPSLPRSRSCALVGVDSFQSVTDVVKVAKLKLGDILSAAEFLDYRALEHSMAYMERNYPLENKYKFFVMLEVSSTSEGGECFDRLQTFLNDIPELAREQAVTETDEHWQEIWGIREGTTESFIKYGYTFKYDVNFHSSASYQIVEKVRDMINDASTLTPGEKEQIVVASYGHIGEFHIHMNCSLPGYDNDLAKKVAPIIDDKIKLMVKESHGSMSWEIGDENDGLGRQDSSSQYARMIKKLFDPKGIMNPYKVFPHKVDAHDEQHK